MLCCRVTKIDPKNLAVKHLIWPFSPVPLKREKTVDPVSLLEFELSSLFGRCHASVFDERFNTVSKILDQNNYLHISPTYGMSTNMYAWSLWWNDGVVIPLQNKHQFLRKSKLWLFSPKWVQQIFTLRQIFELDFGWLCASHYIVSLGC